MRILLVLFLMSQLTACAIYPQHPGGQRIYQPGVSFIPPAGNQWSELMHSTYQITLITKGKSTDETIVVAAQIFQLPPFNSKEEFLKFVQKGRASEPQTGRFEAIRNHEMLDEQRKETCAKHQAASKDFGAKRGGEFTIYETSGMNCIHPKNTNVGVFIELSRKAPPGTTNDEFESLAGSLLKSTQFSDFR